MAFAVVVSWINQAVILRHTIEEPQEAFQSKLGRLNAKLTRDMQAGELRKVKRTLRGLPPAIHNHVFILDPRGRELLGRDRVLERQKQTRSKINSRELQDGEGRTYTLVTTGRRPPRALLSPGPAGVGMRLAVAAFISALVSWILARYLVAPLTRLSRVSRQLAEGDLAARVGGPLVRRKDEFGQLAQDMDEMARRLQFSQEANQRLLRDVSHELRSPLARMRVALEIARNKEPQMVSAELDRIELEAVRLENLVDEVLSLLRESSVAQELKLSRFDLADLLQDLVETVNYEISDDCEPIELQLAPPLSLEADRELLWRVFENLLRNALIHSADTGGIFVRANKVDDDHIEVRVLDSGPGIDEKHIERIFEPFFRADEARNRSSGGHGLGLAIAASAVRRHNGRILAENRQQGGLEVCVVLPVERASGT